MTREDARHILNLVRRGHPVDPSKINAALMATGDLPRECDLEAIRKTRDATKTEASMHPSQSKSETHQGPVILRTFLNAGTRVMRGDAC